MSKSVEFDDDEEMVVEKHVGKSNVYTEQRQEDNLATGRQFSWNKSREVLEKLVQIIERDPNKSKYELQKWDLILPTIQQRARTVGLPLEFIGSLWKIIAHFTSVRMRHTSDKNKVLLIRSMIPEQVLPADLVRQMVNDVHKALLQGFAKDEDTSPGFFKVINAFLEYLVGLNEYSLLESGWVTASVYDNLFRTISHQEVREWLCILLKQICSKNLVRKYQPQRLLSLAGEGYERFQNGYRNVVQLLQLMKLVCPTLLPNNVLSISYGNARPKNIDPGFAELLYAAKLRLASQREADQIGDEPRNQQLNSKFFFKGLEPICSAFSMEGLLNGDVNTKDAAVWVFMEPSRYSLFKLRPQLLMTLDSYLNLNFRHELQPHLYDSKHDEKYTMLLQRSVDLCMLMKHGTQSISSWVQNFVAVWDGTLWRREVLQLFSFVECQSITEPEFELALKNLEMEFLYGSSVRDSLQVWKSLSDLLKYWIDIQTREDNEDSCSFYNTGTSKDVKDLFTFMESLISNFIRAHVKKRQRICALQNFFKLYIELWERYSKKQINFLPVIPQSLFYAVFVVDDLSVFELLCNYLELCKTSTNLSQAAKEMPDWNVESILFYNDALKQYISGTSPMLEVFSTELDAMQDEDRDVLTATIETIIARNSLALGPYLNASSGASHAADVVDIGELKDDAPHYAAFIARTHVSTPVKKRLGPTGALPLRLQNVLDTPFPLKPKYASTPKVRKT